MLSKNNSAAHLIDYKTNHSINRQLNCIIYTFSSYLTMLSYNHKHNFVGESIHYYKIHTNIHHKTNLHIHSFIYCFYYSFQQCLRPPPLPRPRTVRYRSRDAISHSPRPAPAPPAVVHRPTVASTAKSHLPTTTKCLYPPPWRTIASPPPSFRSSPRATCTQCFIPPKFIHCSAPN